MKQCKKQKLFIASMLCFSFIVSIVPLNNLFLATNALGATDGGEVRVPGNYSEDFASASWSGSPNVVNAENMQRLTALPEEGGDVITPSDYSVRGTVVWKFQSDENTTFTNFHLTWQGRAIMGDSNYVKLYAGTDGITYGTEPVDQIRSWIDDTGPNGPTTPREVDLTSVAYNHDTVYIKAELYNNSGGVIQWVNINRMEVVSVDTGTNEARAPGSYSEDFTSASWSGSPNVAYVVNTQRLTVLPEEGGDAIAPSDYSMLGTVIWKFQSDENTTFTNFHLTWQGRAIMGDSNYVKLYAGTDGITYGTEPVDQIRSWIDDTGPNGPTTPREVDLTSVAYNHDTVYIKAELYNNSGGVIQWVNINRMEVVSENTGAGSRFIDDNPRDLIGSQVVTYHLGDNNEDITASGPVTQGTVTAKAGSVSNAYEVRSIARDGSITIAVPESLGTSTNLKLEIREIHQREDDNLDYQVLLNGSFLYKREHDPSSDGAYHCFIDIPKSALRPAGNEITIINTGAQDLRISDIWIYENFLSLMEEEQTYRPLEVVLFYPNISYSDYEADLNVLMDMKNRYAGYHMYTIGIGFDIWYMNHDMATLKTRLDHLMRLSIDAGFPLKLNLNSWWSGTPSGMDGLGGFWKDIVYNQVIYDAANINGRGVWQLSTPNMWSNTPWLTLNNEHYNQVRADKLRELSEYIAAKQAEYINKGNDPDITLFTENEPIYWAYQHYNPSSPEGRADLSHAVISRAALDGVILDPTDGYTQEEELWLFNNLTTYISQVGASMSEGAGTNSILVNNGQITEPTDQITENIYSHIMLNYDYPIADDENLASWEAHVTDNLRLGIEGVNEISRTDMGYIIARGRYANVNAERSAMSNFDFLPLYYEAGADHVIIFNYHNGDHSLITDADRGIEELTALADIRNRNLWVGYRADAERIIEELQSKGVSDSLLADVLEAYGNGRYATAYGLLMSKVTTAQLPAAFSVKGNGSLGDYPVNISNNSEDVVYLKLYEADESLHIKAMSDHGIPVQLNWTKGGSYELQALGDGEYKLAAAAEGSYQSVNGVVSVAITPVKYVSKDYPAGFDAMFTGLNNNMLRLQSQDAAIGEYAHYVELSLSEGYTIVRGCDGKPETFADASLADLVYGDKLELTLNELDEITGITAIYGHRSGKVKLIEYPVVNGFEEPTNAFITIEDQYGVWYRYELSSITAFDYPTMTGNGIFTSILTDYGLQYDDNIEISYSPYSCNGSELKVIKLYQPYETVLDEDFEDGTWSEKVYAANNIYITRLDSNYSDLVAAAQDKNAVGSITWEIAKNDGSHIESIFMEYCARSILNTSLKWYLSADGGTTWELLKDNGDWGNFASPQTVYKTGIAAAAALVKVEMSSVGIGDPDTWSSLNSVIIKIPQ